MLRLIRASKNRPGGPWSDDDYDVYDGDRHIGRIFLSPQSPNGHFTISEKCPRLHGLAHHPH
jgi:hypothetical protein